MKYKKLGRTDIDVSLICLGTMTWGNQNTEAEGHEQMDYALDQGVNFFDTAEFYSIPARADLYGETERIIGTWFKERGQSTREKVVLATKVVGGGPAWVRDGKTAIDRKNILLAVEDSLKRMQTDYIDLYQLHWPNRPHYHFGKHHIDFSNTDPRKEEENFLDVLHTLDELIKQGKIRHVGLSNESAWGTMKYLNLAEKHGLPRMASIQNEYSLLCRVFEPELSEVAQMEDIGLLAWSPLATGIISGKYLDNNVPKGTRRDVSTSSTHRIGDYVDDATRAYIGIAEKYGLDVCQMALAFACQQPFMTSVIIGATNMNQLKTNIGAESITLDEDVIADINAVYAQYTRPF